MVRIPPGGNDNGDKPQKPGLFSSLSQAVREISAEIRKDLAPTPAGGKAANFKAPDHLAKTVASAQGGLAFVENPEGAPGKSGPALHAPAGGLRAPAKPLNPWPELRQPGSHKKYVTDAYYHAYTPADLRHYIESLRSERMGVSLIACDAGDQGLREEVEGSLRLVAGMFGAMGYSPRNLQPNLDELDASLTSLLNNNPKILAVGPVGLDLTYTSHNLMEQTSQLARQLEIAGDFGLPALLFQNGALAELKNVLESGLGLPKLIWLKPITSQAELDIIQEYDFYVAFRAELTWPKEVFYRQSVQQILPQRWLAGAGNSLKSTHNRSGQFNSAASLEEIIQTMSELLEVDEKQLRDRLNMNFAAVYGPSQNPEG